VQAGISCEQQLHAINPPHHNPAHIPLTWCIALRCCLTRNPCPAGRVLVHCVHGQSRSAAVVIAFLMWSSGQTYDICLQAVRACRPRVQPNSGFELQLRLLEQLEFDFSRWPGWSADTYAVARQQQLLRQQSDSSQQLMLDAQQQQHAFAGLPKQQQLLQQQALLFLQQQQQQRPQLLPPQQQQQHQRVCAGVVADDSGQQDLVMLTSPLPSPSGACSDVACACSKGTLRVDSTRSRGSTARSLHLDVAVDIQQEQQQKHSKDGSQAPGAISSRRPKSVCCTIM
jgi:hypothetical protein